MKAALADCALVTAEKDEHASFVRLQGKESEAGNDEQWPQPDRNEDRGPDFRIIPSNIADPLECERENADGDGQHDPSARNTNHLLGTG